MFTPFPGKPSLVGIVSLSPSVASLRTCRCVYGAHYPSGHTPCASSVMQWCRVLPNKDVQGGKSVNWIWTLRTLASRLKTGILSPSGALFFGYFPSLSFSILPSEVFLSFRAPLWEESSSAFARLPLNRHPDTQIPNPHKVIFHSLTLVVPERLW